MINNCFSQDLKLGSLKLDCSQLKLVNNMSPTTFLK